MNRLESRLEEAVNEFNDKSLSEILDDTYAVAGSSKAVTVRKNLIKNALKKICPTNAKNKLSKDLLNHFDEIEHLIPFCSSPQSFRSAWDLRSNILNKFDADTLVNEGAQIIPFNKNLRIFQANQQGVELGINQRLVLAVRHVEGNYDDDLDNQLVFTYQPPADATGMLRYRWCQCLSSKLEIPFVVIAVMWFEYKVNDSINLVFVACPAKIIDYENDLNDLSKSLNRPFKLKLVNRTDVYNILSLLRSLNQTDLSIETRPQLPITLAREWAFDRINSSPKGRKIKRWAIKMGYSCPGSLCNHVKFEKLKSSKIAFGHIISQDWAKSFTYLLEKKDHPDNLYLTCQSCNSSLSNKFPNEELKKKIEAVGTIGDWLRKAEKEIRES